MTEKLFCFQRGSSYNRKQIKLHGKIFIYITVLRKMKQYNIRKIINAGYNETISLCFSQLWTY